MPVVMAVDRSPPECATLHGSISPGGEDELEEARGAKGPMREVAMIEASDRKHARDVEQSSDGYCCPTPADPDHADATEVKVNEGKRPTEFELVRPRPNRLGTFGEIVGIEKLPKSNQQAREERT